MTSASTSRRCSPCLDHAERPAQGSHRERNANGCEAMSRAEEQTPKVGNSETPPEDGLVSQLIGMTAALWASHQRRKVVSLLVALVAVVGAIAFAQILLNAWN